MDHRFNRFKSERSPPRLRSPPRYPERSSLEQRLNDKKRENEELSWREKNSVTALRSQINILKRANQNNLTAALFLSNELSRKAEKKTYCSHKIESVIRDMQVIDSEGRILKIFSATQQDIQDIDAKLLDLGGDRTLTILEFLLSTIKEEPSPPKEPTLQEKLDRIGIGKGSSSSSDSKRKTSPKREESKQKDSSSKKSKKSKKSGGESDSGIHDDTSSSDTDSDQSRKVVEY